MYIASKFWPFLSNDALMPVTTTTGNQAYTIGLAAVVAGKSYIDWGDGTAFTPVDYTAGAYNTYSHTYVTIGSYNARIVGKSNIKSLRKTALEGLTALDLNGMPLSFLSLTATGTTVSGIITGMPLSTLSLSGTGASITGSITGMPLTFLSLSGTGTYITGTIAGMALTYLSLVATGTAVLGTISISSRLTRLYLSGSDSIKIPTTGLVFGASLTTVVLTQTVGSTSSEIDSMLIAAAATTWTAPKTITASGNNAAHTSASAVALATLTSLGVTYTVN